MTQYKRLLYIVGLEVYAAVLTALQMLQGVRTDEAKYLLNIPYPHPPFTRFTISLLDGWDYHEIFWRFILASLMVQAVWLILAMARGMKQKEMYVGLAVCWLAASSVVLQAGSVMMAPLTALQGLVFIWLYLRGKDNTAYAYLITLFWLMSLFTAYQAVLFGPLVLGVFLQMKLPLWKKLLLVGLPIALLSLYTLSNPLALASMVNHAEKDAAETLLQKIMASARVWMLGGSYVLSIVGFVGLMWQRKWPLIGGFILVAAYVFLSRYDYYAILFTPLVIAGVLPFMSRRIAPLMAMLTVLGTAILVVFYPFSPASRAHGALTALEEQGITEVLINGSFGHEWQYSSIHVRRYRPDFLQEVQAIVCLQECAGMSQQTEWKPLSGLPFEIWIADR